MFYEYARDCHKTSQVYKILIDLLGTEADISLFEMKIANRYSALDDSSVRSPRLSLY